MAKDRNELLDDITRRVAQAIADRPANQVAVLTSHASLRDLTTRFAAANIPHELVDHAQIRIEAPTVKLLTQ